MTLTFLLSTLAITMAALALLLWPLLRDKAATDRRLRDARSNLQALNEARAAGELESSEYSKRRGALGETLVSLADASPRRMAPILCSMLAVAILVPLAALGIHRLLAPAQEFHAGPAMMSAAHMMGTVVPHSDHGTDMEAAIEKLANKLREHPDDAEGWALLGRTYKAMERYTQAKEAFHHAMEAAPGDAGFAHEYAEAETPSAPEPQPSQSPVGGTSITDAISAAANLDAAARR